MNALPLWGAAVAAAAAGAFAVADGALLAIGDEERERDPRVRALCGERERLHRSLSFARVVALLVAGAAVAMAFELGRRSGGQAAARGALAAIVIVAIFEAGGRAIGDALGTPAALRLAPAARALDMLLAPAGFLGERVERLLHRVLPQAPRAREEREATAEQFREVLAAEADVSRDEEALLHGVFSLGDTAVHEVMVPRVDVVGVERSTRWSEVLDRVRSSEHARFPVYDDTIDEVVGVLYTKDLIAPAIADEEPPAGWMTLVRPAVFIPATKTIDAQLRDFKASRTHIAIVVDEYGGTAGVVTIEDVLEEIVGDIRDEYDVDEPMVEMGIGGDSFWVAGRLTIDELGELLGHDFDQDGVSTVGGLVYARLGRVPRAGEELTLGGFRIVVERVVRRRVQRVYFERLPQIAVAPSA